MDYDALFKDIFYKVMQDCDNNEESSYECAKIMFAVKNKGVTPPTLQGIKEDQLLLKNDAMVHVNNTVTSYKKIKVKKYIDYSIPNIVKCNFGTFSDTGMKIKDCHYLVHVVGVYMVGFPRYLIIMIMIQKNHYYLKDPMRNTTTNKFPLHGKIGNILRVEKELMIN